GQKPGYPALNEISCHLKAGWFQGIVCIQCRGYCHILSPCLSDTGSVRNIEFCSFSQRPHDNRNKETGLKKSYFQGHSNRQEYQEVLHCFLQVFARPFPRLCEGIVSARL